MSEKKCPFLYDGCMCSIPECGEHCPERIKFPDGKGGFDTCPYSKEARDIIEAALECKEPYRLATARKALRGDYASRIVMHGYRQEIFMPYFKEAEDE